MNELANELIRRRLALESLDDYAAYMATSQHLDFIHSPAKHHRVMTQALDNLLIPLDDPRHPRDSHGTPITKLLITAPPGAAKSTYISVHLATHYWARNPTHHILCSSNVGDLAQAFNRRRRSACMTQEWQNLSQTSLDPEAKGVDQFYNLQGGSIKAAGVGATIVGIRSNLNILDDPIESWEQSQSITQLQKIWDWYEGEYRNRQYGVPGALEVLMHQRWSAHDPAGILMRLIESGEEQGWMVINLPLVAYDDPTEPDPVHRDPGEVLWPENKVFNSANLEVLRRDHAKWAALYQQRPLDEKGGWVGHEHLQYIEVRDWENLKAQHAYRYIGTGDLALSINRGDATWLGVWAITPDRDLILCDAIRQQVSVEETVTEVYRLQTLYHCEAWLFDDDPSTKVFHRLILEHARTDEVPPLPFELMPLRGQQKEVRAAAIRGYFRAGRVYLLREPRWIDAAVREIIAFPSEPDDFVDMAGLIGRRMVQISGIQSENDRKRPPIQPMLVEKDGQAHLSLSLDALFEQRDREQAAWRNQTIRIG